MMKTLTSNLRTPKNDAGSSLIEVVVASVIMAMIGLALVTVTVGAKPLADRFNAKSVALSSLAFAAKQIQLQPIQATDCRSADKIQPYLFGSNAAKGGIGFVISIIKDFSPALVGSGYTYTVTPSTLPTGLTLSPSTGEITGTPTKESSSNYTIVATKGDEISKEVINISVITVSVKINVSTDVTKTDFQSCATNAAGISAATAGYTKSQIIQEVVLSTSNDITKTTRLIVKLG